MLLCGSSRGGNYCVIVSVAAVDGCWSMKGAAKSVVPKIDTGGWVGGFQLQHEEHQHRVCHSLWALMYYWV